MSIGHRRTKLVYSAIEQLIANGREEVRPGDIAAQLRSSNRPLSYWEIRGELSNLEAEGLIEVHAATGAWRQSAAAARKAG